MEPWIIGVIAVLVIGVAVIVFGAVNDRAKNRRRTAEMLAPPDRAIPQLSPTAAGPDYVSDLQARRARTEPPAAAPGDITLPATADHPRRLRVQGLRHRPRAPAGRAGVAGDPGLRRPGRQHPRTALDPGEDDQAPHTPGHRGPQPRPAGPVDPRGQPDPAEAAGRGRRRARGEATETGSPNSPSPRHTIRSDRQAGYVPTEHLGHAARWISTSTASYLIPIPDHG